jgi:hypothetical protein
VNFGQLKARVLADMGVPSSGDGLATLTRAGEWVNTALRKITVDRDWYWNLAEQTGIVFNNGEAALPTRFMKAFALSVQGYPVTQISKTDYVAQAVTELPNPFGWLVVDNAVKLAPAPSGIVNDTLFLYYCSEPALTADVDVPRMPDAYHDALVDYAVSVGYRAKQDAARSGLAMASYQGWAKSMGDDTTPTKKAHIRRTRDQPVLTLGASGFTFLTAPGPYAGGLILCTSTTRPVSADGQWIFETDTRRFFEYDAAAVVWRVPWQVEWKTVYAMSDVIAL